MNNSNRYFNYIERLKEENKMLKQQRESCVIENLVKKNRKSIDAIKNGEIKEVTSFTNEENDVIFDYLIDINNSIVNLKTDVVCSKFGTLNQSKLEYKLLNLINKSEKLLKFIIE